MRTLAERIVGAIPEGREGLSLREAMRLTGEDRAHVRAAFGRIKTNKMAIIVRRGRGRGLYAARLDSGVLACAVCDTEFERKPESKRVTCSRACHASLGWGDETARAARRKTLSEVQSSPEAVARTRRTNKARWTRPGEKEKLAARNREMWADPEMHAFLSAKIALRNGTAEMRKFYSDMRKAFWADPEMRKKMTDAVNRSEAVQAYRANFGTFLRRRWADPELRAKYTEANRLRNSVKKREAASATLKALWADPVWREQQLRRMKRKSRKEKAVATRKERGWWKKNRRPEVTP